MIDLLLVVPLASFQRGAAHNLPHDNQGIPCRCIHLPARLHSILCRKRMYRPFLACRHS